MMSLKFLYFDLGIVLVDFSIERMLRQIAAVADMRPERIEAVIFAGGLQREYELGRISSREFHERFCRDTGTRPSFDDLLQAAGEIFSLNYPMLAVAARLQQAGWPLGILSNTCECHWEYCMKEYPALAQIFSLRATSYQIGAVKPDAAIFNAAAKMAGCAPEEIFFVDDIAGHVAGAKAAGFDAVQYATTSKFVEDLRSRGIKFNY
ncbi:MAG: HAD family phosphatase [Pirellulales bacterium]|nr:HAD family phosphatase [Pirellulales bacterium]